MMDGLQLIFCLIVLIKGAAILVEGASAVANRLGISGLIIGLTVVSFGISMSELLVSLTSRLKSSPDLAIANVIGSDIANVLLVLGIAEIVRLSPVRNYTVVSEIPFSPTAALLVGFLANAHLFSEDTVLSISHVDGGILLFFCLLFLLYVYIVSITNESRVSLVESVRTMKRALAYILLGAMGLYFGGQWVVDGA